MSKPKVLIYTPMGAVDAQYSKLEDAGCELSWGDPEWRRDDGGHGRQDKAKRTAAARAARTEHSSGEQPESTRAPHKKGLQKRKR